MNNIQNPFIGGNKLLLPTEADSVEIAMNNFYKYFKNVYVLIKKNDLPLDKNCFMKQIDQKTLNDLNNNLVIWKCNFHILKNKINFDKTIILQKNKLEIVNNFGFKLEEYNLVLPILTISFKNIISYLENKNGESNLENIYNNVVLTNYFKDDPSNIKNKFQFDHLIKSMEESNYWCYPYNCLTNLNDAFKNRKFNNIFMKKLFKDGKNEQNEEKKDYLDMIFKKNKYVDASNVLKKNGYKLYKITNKSLYSKDDINKLFLILDEKQKYLLFCNLLVSKVHCHLVINNEFILDLMRNCMIDFAPLFRYLIGYSWIRFYFEESIKKSNLKTDDDIVFDINTASKLPIFPFVNSFPKYNPYMPILVSDDQLASQINICGLNEFKITEKNKKIFNNGICNLQEFKKRLNLFITNNPNVDIFNNLEWSKNKIAISGSVITACLQKEHPLMNLFTEVNEEARLIRYFNEYYALSDVDVMILTQNPFEYMKNVSEFHSQIVVNTCVMNAPYAEAEQIKLKPLFQAYIIVQENWIKQNIVNENLDYNYIFNNIENPLVKELFKPYFKIEMNKKMDEELKDKDIEEMKKNYPDYFLDYEKYDIKIRIYNNSNKVFNDSISIKINYKYKITSPHLNHPFELFMAKGDDFMSLVSQFHLPCVRGYYDGYNVFMTPSCVSAHLTYMNIDYKYFAGTKDLIEIINKNRMRGFGTWLNKNEIDNYITYSTEVDFWKKIYGDKKTIINLRGTLPINHTLFHPRMVNPEQYYECTPIDFENAYNNFEYESLLSIKEINDQIKIKNKIMTMNLDMNDFKTIDKDGSIIPLQKWVIEAYYEYYNLLNKKAISI